MTLTEDFIKKVMDAAKAYDKATDIHERTSLGIRFDALIDELSEGQLKQVAKRLIRL